MWNVHSGTNEKFFIVDADQYMLKTTHDDVKAMEAFKLSVHDLVLLAASSALSTQYDAVKVKDHVEGELYTIFDSYDEDGIGMDNYNSFMHVINLSLAIAWPLTRAVDNLQKRIPNAELIDVDVMNNGTVIFKYQE
jgi:hypothetical protein